MKKSLLVLAVLVLIITTAPAVANAAWWNPFSWFKHSESTQKTETPSESKDKKEAGTTNTNIPSSTDKIVVKMGETVTVRGIHATPTKIVEDSRCSSGVTCIQAGTVKVNVRASYGVFFKNVVLGLNVPYTFRGNTVTLTDVQPGKIKDATIPESSYIFTFSLGKQGSQSDNENANKQESKDAKDTNDSKGTDQNKNSENDSEGEQSQGSRVNSLQNLRVSGEMFKTSASGSFTGFCASAGAVAVLNTVLSETGHTPVCNDSASAWAASVSIGVEYQCVDSAGVMRQGSTGLAAGQTSCS